MAWTATVNLDPDKPDTGLVIAIWNAGQADEFQYARRAKITAAEKTAFVSEAKAALAAYQTKVAAEANYASQLAAALNA
jgi:hypothetical protein